MGVTVQVLAVDVLVHAFLLDHEDLRAQAQNGVQLLLAQVTVVFADPFDCHGVLSADCLVRIVSAREASV